MKKVQRTYTAEFKREAVRLAQTSGKPIAQVARELGISDASIHQWRKELAEYGAEAFPGSGHQTALEEENRRLKRELERTRQERDILKKRLLSSRTASYEIPIHRSPSGRISGECSLRDA
jgi:transposase